MIGANLSYLILFYNYCYSNLVFFINLNNYKSLTTAFPMLKHHMQTITKYGKGPKPIKVCVGPEVCYPPLSFLNVNLPVFSEKNQPNNKILD